MVTPSTDTDTHSSDLRQAAAAALHDVDALRVEGADRSIVLEALLRTRLSRFTGTGPKYSTDGTHSQHDEGNSSDVTDDGDALDKIGAALKLDRDTLELVYALQDGEPNVVVSAKKIASNKSLAARQLGQLIAAARQIVNLEDWTPSAVIRRVVEDYGRLDSGNFAATIQQMDGVAVIRGKGQSREIKITKPGLEATAELIRTLAGVES